MSAPIRTKDKSASQLLKEIRSNIGVPQGINTLLTGMPATKKSNSLRTWPAPILVHCFDSGGVYHLDDEQDRIIIDRRWMNLNIKKPRTFSEWSEEFEDLRSHPTFFSQIGTFVIDSLSSFEMCAMAELLEKEPHKQEAREVKRQRTHELGAMTIPPTEQTHYGAWANLLELVVRQCCALPCHFVLVSHVKDETNKKGEPTGKKILDISGQKKNNLHKHFTEVYYAELDPRGNGHWWTKGNSNFIARTNIGPTVFSQKEPQDFKALLEKAGRPYEDLDLIEL